MKAVSAFVMLGILSGCTQVQPSNDDEVSRNIGRYAYYPPAGEMPAVLLDTATGCVETFGKAVSVQNPKDVSWWRSYSDTGVAEVTYANGESKEIPGTTPPKRCLQHNENPK